MAEGAQAGTVHAIVTAASLLDGVHEHMPAHSTSWSRSASALRQREGQADGLILVLAIAFRARYSVPCASTQARTVSSVATSTEPAK